MRRAGSETLASVDTAQFGLRITQKGNRFRRFDSKVSRDDLTRWAFTLRRCPLRKHSRHRLSSALDDARNPLLKRDQTMTKSLEQRLACALSSLNEAQTFLTKLDTSKKALRSIVDALLPPVKDAISHLEEAHTANFDLHTRYALSPDTFNPFNLLDVERYYSRSRIDNPVRTVLLLKRIENIEPGVGLASPEARIGNRVS